MWGVPTMMVANRKSDGTCRPVLSFPPAVTKVDKFDRDKGKWMDQPLSRLENRAVVEFNLAPGNGELLMLGGRSR